ncbi:nitroreductase [Vannielia litorea]|uniref:nitroreductase family protein n=1 Tax=Vannielia litorea TaxID=1217970 RepID=UPI001C9568B2|nr:nitroreductase [Vannielia litorea]MBY6048403.1 nitroreductase [Vannielia litorea]MBY6075817.1 nitroreductase [Vannielia litorea]
MTQKSPAALEFLLTRRSRPAKTLTAPVPTREELGPILQAAARTPDHGKLEPWRFIVLEGAALERLAELAGERGAALELEPEKVEKFQNQLKQPGLAVAVVSSPVESEKVPFVEQLYSAGAVCLAMLNAALASGWGANWLSGWGSHDREFVTKGLGLALHETVAGFIHIGTETVPAPERPRPDLTKITAWVSE